MNLKFVESYKLEVENEHRLEILLPNSTKLSRGLNMHTKCLGTIFGLLQIQIDHWIYKRTNANYRYEHISKVSRKKKLQNVVSSTTELGLII